ncbi:MAG TPA: sulfite exporter TauE/SafE family protein [Fluviicola sp.]|nr:sulfite exporter TauE/SafE family protein [Fluviicola sp.]
MLEIIGFCAALLVGLVLGLLGGGGSILALPVMVYLFQIPANMATAYSLFVIGIAALIGTFQNVRNRLVQPKTALLFSIPAVVSIAIARKYILPNLPDKIHIGDQLVFQRDTFIMILFAILMILASIPMIRGQRERQGAKRPRPGILAFFGIIVGVISGMVGAGGGFLIIPALSIFMKVPIKTAIATSIMIIAINSLAGFSIEMMDPKIDWKFLLLFTAIAVVGVLIGIFFNKKVNAEKLKSGFGYFVLGIGLFILVREWF